MEKLIREGLESMRLFKKKDKRQDGEDGGGRDVTPIIPSRPAVQSAPRAAQLLAKLPDPVLERIFANVCPHTQDHSYDTQEQSSIEDECMLCGLRDLSHCIQVCRRWGARGITVLYHSIRIDTVHYCEREAALSDKRKRRSFFNRNGRPEDPATARLQLLCRTLREDPARLGPIVQFLKMPYMVRESRAADIARIIAVLPNLRYVDLPEGLYTDEPAYTVLRLEVHSRCQNLRKMTFMGGSERSLAKIIRGDVFKKLEVMELSKIKVDPTTFLHVLGALDNLRALKIMNCEVLTDDVLAHNNPQLPAFPALEELILSEVQTVTVGGLRAYLGRFDAQKSLKVLSLTETGVEIWALQEFLAFAANLKHFSVNDVVKSSLPAAAGGRQVFPLASKSLVTLHFEITSAEPASPFNSTAASYYNYLSTSLLAGGFPNLRAVYVRDANFADTLAGFAPPGPAFAEGAFIRPSSSGTHSSSGFSTSLSRGSLGAAMSSSGFLSPQHSPGQNYPQLQPQYGENLNPFHSPVHTPQKFPLPQTPPRFATNNPFASPTNPTGQPYVLEVYTKGDDELDWSIVKVRPGHIPGSQSGDSNRPVSSYGLDNSASSWNPGAGARKSVFIGNGASGFLAVPETTPPSALRRGSAQDEWPRPGTSSREKKRDQYDLWR